MKFITKIKIIIVVILILLATAFFSVSYKKGGIITYERRGSESFFPTVKDTILKSPADNLTKQESSQNTTPQEQTEDYSNTKYNFSFKHPKNVTIGSFKEGEEGDIILIQTSDKKTEFQIFIAPYDEVGPITAERIKQDLPDLIIKNPQSVVIAGGGLNSLIFESESESLGTTREVWFIKNGFLYQVTARVELDWFIGPILETLRF